MTRRQALALFAVLAARPALAQEPARSLPPTYSSLKPTPLGEVRRFLGRDQAPPSVGEVTGSAPAWRWYGYGTPAPGSNPMAPEGTYLVPPPAWLAQVGATPGAVPIGSRPLPAFAQEVAVRRVEPPAPVETAPPPVERSDIPVSRIPVAESPPVDAVPLPVVSPEPSRGVPAEEMPARPDGWKRPGDPPVEAEEFDWKAAPKGGPAAPSWPKVVAEELPEAAPPKPLAIPLKPVEPEQVPSLPVVEPVRPGLTVDDEKPSLPPTGTPVTRDRTGRVVPVNFDAPKAVAVPGLLPTSVSGGRTLPGARPAVRSQTPEADVPSPRLSAEGFPVLERRMRAAAGGRVEGFKATAVSPTALRVEFTAADRDEAEAAVRRVSALREVLHFEVEFKARVR